MKKVDKQKINTLKKIKNIVLKTGLVAIIPLAILFALTYPFRLNVQAYLNEKYLNNITVLDNYKLKSSAKPDGDFLTGSDALAVAEITVDDTLENLYNATMSNLKNQGYTGDGFTNTSSSDHDVYFKTTNGNKSIVLEYKFKEKIDCDVANDFKVFCADRGYKTIETSGLKTMNITKIRIIYDND